MLRFLRLSKPFSSIPPRRQNFFQLNPTFPDQGQKDFDIYNTDYKHIDLDLLTNNDQLRYQQLKKQLTKQVYLGPVNTRQARQDAQDKELDLQYGFPIGIHEDFDNFIQIFKRQKKVGSNITGQFQNIVMKLMQQFGAKSEVQLIKIFRFNLANSKKQGFKDKIRALVINSAFIEFMKERHAEGKSNESLTLEEIVSFQNKQGKEKKFSTGEISKKELEEIVTRGTLQELDQKIRKIEDEVKAKAIADGRYIPTYHPKYGVAIEEDVNTNMGFDLNFPRGHKSMTKTNQAMATPQQVQDNSIEGRINKLFFAQALRQLQNRRQIEPQKMISLHNLPLNIRYNDKLINSLLFKYKEEDLLIEPDLEDIYKDIDIAMKKIAVKVVPNYLDNERQNREGITSSDSSVKERIISKDLLLWRQLDAEEIFQPELYTEQEVNKVKVEQKQIQQLSPSSVLELSLNKMPFNLYRHADLDQFTVFNKYRKKIFSDYATDKIIDPELQFKFFSLDQAQGRLKKIKKSEEVPDKYYGWAWRKTGEAEVFVTKGNGKVMVNDQPLADYFGDVYHRGEALKPLIITEVAGKWDLEFHVVGGGLHSQSECMAMALTKALVMIDPKYEQILAMFGLVGVDDRKREPKRIGLYSARVRPPYVRR